MKIIQRKTSVKFKTVLTNSNCKLFLGLGLTSYIQAADDSKRTYSPAWHSALSEIVSLVSCAYAYAYFTCAMLIAQV